MQISLPKNTASIYPPNTGAAPRIQLLDYSAQDEVLAFLARPLVHTAYLSSLINDNGLVSSFNRGSFYGYRNYFGKLEGIALIGHAILIETVSDEALRGFAEVAQKSKKAHLIMGEENSIDSFWGYYAKAGQEMRRACRELMFELRWPVEVSRQPNDLRWATAADLNLITSVHAEMAFEESGVDPREHDVEGFTERCARRIEQGRTWVVTAHEKLLFKADVLAETPKTTYLEGVWVNPEERGRGVGRGCLGQLARMLLWRTESISLCVNDDNEQAQTFYKKAGFHLRTVYDTIFLK